MSYLVATALADRYKIDLDSDRVLKMAIFHDVGEAATGEIATAVKDLLPAETLRETEHRLLSALLKGLPAADEVEKLVREYDAGDTNSALIVKFADVLDAVGHAKDRLHTSFPEYLERRAAWFRAKAEAGSPTAGILSRWLTELIDEWPGRRRPWAPSGAR